MDETIEISQDLRVVVEHVDFVYYSLFSIRGDDDESILIDVKDIPKLIEVLQGIQERAKTLTPKKEDT